MNTKLCSTTLLLLPALAAAQAGAPGKGYACLIEPTQRIEREDAMGRLFHHKAQTPLPLGRGRGWGFDSR